jgi:hypothetical protein
MKRHVVLLEKTDVVEVHTASIIREMMQEVRDYTALHPRRL